MIQVSMTVSMSVTDFFNNNDTFIARPTNPNGIVSLEHLRGTCRLAQMLPYGLPKGGDRTFAKIICVEKRIHA